MTKISIEDYKRIYKNKGNKFNAKSSTYNGRHYDSKKEAEYAMELDWLKKEKIIMTWNPQCKLSLDINDIHIANYFVDFQVIYSDGKIEYHEVKGYETALWRLKWKMAIAIYGKEKFVLIK